MRYLVFSLILSVISTVVVRNVYGIEDLSQLVDGLVSSNAPPVISNDPRPGIPEYAQGYSQAERDRVRRVWDHIVDLGSAAFPVLVEHSGDRRYCTTEVLNDWKNLTVGDVCRRTIQVQVEIYHNSIDESPGDVLRYVPTGPRESLVKWWKENEKLSLSEIQARAVEWALQKYKDDSTYRGRRKAANIANLEKILRRLKTGKTAIVVDRTGRFLSDRDLESPREE
jgi:hypothetical protein